MGVNDAGRPIEWETSHWFRKWTFMLVNPMIERGCDKALQYNDLMQLPSHELSGPLHERLAAYYRATSDEGRLGVPKLLLALGKANWYESAVIGLWSIGEGAVRISSPVVLRLLLQALQSPTDAQQSRDAYMYAGILGFLGVAQCIIHHVLFYYSMRLGQNFMIASTSLIYHNLFNLKIGGSRFTTGELVNFISNDVGRYEEFAVFASFIYCSILEVVAILIILIFQLNVASAFAAVAMTCFFIPVQLYIASRFAYFRTATARATDHRVRFVSEVINGIASVKAYGWEKSFFKLITALRRDELEHIRQSQTLKAFNLGLYFFSPSLANFATFVVFWATGGELTLPIVFSTISLLQQLRTTMGRQWTRGIETYSEATSSSRRIDAFISAVNSDGDAHERTQAVAGTTPAADDVEMTGSPPSLKMDILVDFADTSYTYDPSDSGTVAQSVLSGINFRVSRGELVMVVGSVGAGKSSLLAAILGELNEVSVDGGPAIRAARVVRDPATRIAYCQQRPWILSGSVRTNIVLAGMFDNGIDDFKCPSYIDEELYSRAVESCCLVSDLDNWPDYDATEIGEKGVSVSGGQKARLALARAVYSNSDLYILDDPLSAVDAKVGRSLFRGCVMGLRSANKAVLLATHQLQYLPHADRVVVLHQGHQVFCGSYAELLQSQQDFPYLELSSTMADSVEDDDDDEEEEEGRRGDAADHNGWAMTGRYDRHLLEIRKNRDVEKVIVDEERNEGEVSLDLVVEYLRSGGVLTGCVALCVAVFSQALLMVTDYWLKWWASNAFFASQRSTEYVYIFAILTFACVLMGPLRAELFFRFHRSASYAMSERCLWGLLHTPLLFFNSNPSGRILNRFSKDQNLADESFPMVLFDFAENCLLFCLAAAILVVVSLPWLILIMPPLLLIFFRSRQKYIKCSREIKRLQAVSRSPIYSDFSATLDGLITLRAYKLESRITRSFHILLDRNSRVWFSFTMVSRWLGFRMDSKAAIILICLVVLAVVLRNDIDTGLIGYAIVYTMSLSGLMQWCVRQSGEVESQFTSIERISAYGHLRPEEGYSSSLDSYNNQACGAERRFSLDKILVPSKNSIDSSSVRSSRKNSLVSHGRLELRGLDVKYRDNMANVIDGLCLSIPAGTKIGVCGRTGSGKSTLLLALMRLNVIAGGDILLDDESLTSMSLETARSRISVIPQDPHLFSGSIRFNLDPFSVYTDAEVWEALENAHISETVRVDPLGLQAVVEEGGKNFSVGQRQLFSLARAVLRKCNVVLMDEVTASIDYATDRLIQKTIRECPSLRDATIVTVAHRLRSIADSDMVAVLQHGSLLEVGKPADLLRDDSSEFRALVEDSNEFDDIFAIATTPPSYKI